MISETKEMKSRPVRNGRVAIDWWSLLCENKNRFYVYRGKPREGNENKTEKRIAIVRAIGEAHFSVSSATEHKSD
jgi:hypothetical protein